MGRGRICGIAPARGSQSFLRVLITVPLRPAAGSEDVAVVNCDRARTRTAGACDRPLTDNRPLRPATTGPLGFEPRLPGLDPACCHCTTSLRKPPAGVEPAPRP